MPLPQAHRPQSPITYRDRQDRVWSVSEVAVLKVVAPAIDGPNRFLVIRFEHEGQERFARWIGETDWREQPALERLFETTDSSRGIGIAPAETVALWVKLVASMGPDELTDVEARTLGTWDRRSLTRYGSRSIGGGRSLRDDGAVAPHQADIQEAAGRVPSRLLKKS